MLAHFTQRLPHLEGSGRALRLCVLDSRRPAAGRCPRWFTAPPDTRSIERKALIQVSMPRLRGREGLDIASSVLAVRHVDQQTSVRDETVQRAATAELQLGDLPSVPSRGDAPLFWSSITADAQ